MPPGPATRARALVAQLRTRADPAYRAGQERFGITAVKRLGVRTPVLRATARPHRGDHDLALALWETGVHEARHLAAMVDDPALVTKRQMNEWARDWATWDLCDGCCWGLFDRTQHAVGAVADWSRRRGEFVKRGAFAIVAGLAVHAKHEPDRTFLAFLPVIEHGATDERHYVKKGVSWALREIGKRNDRLRQASFGVIEHLRAVDARSARWIASDAARDLSQARTPRRARP